MEVSITEAAALLGKSERQIRYMVQNALIAARKVGGRWLIDNEKLPRSDGQAEAKQRKERGLRRAVENALGLSEEVASRYSVKDLKAFQVALPIYFEAIEHLSEEHPAARQLRRVLHFLALGCHRFNPEEKAAAYSEARDAASLAVCELLISRQEEVDALRIRIEQDLMAGFAGLLSRLQARKKRN